MKTATEKAREFLMENRFNECSTVEQHLAYDKFTDRVWWAWENWDDDVTKPFWGGDAKPDDPTDLFRQNYASNEDSDDLQEVIEAFNL